MSNQKLSETLFEPKSIALIVKSEGEGVIAVDGLIVFRDK